MRLDAARLKGCFGSCFRQKLLPEVQGVPPPRASEEPASRRVFRFWRSLYRPVDPGSSPLILKTWNFSPLSRSAARSPFSRSEAAAQTVPKGRIEQGATESFGGRSTPEQGPEPRDREAEKSLWPAVHHSTMGGILQALDLGQELLRG